MGLLVFISYATPDSKFYKISQVAKKLEQYEEIDQVLFWEEHMHDDIIKYMNDNLGRCDAFLIFCSSTALQSEPVEMEWMTALKLKKKIVPIFAREQDIPPLLTTKLGVPFRVDDLDGTVKAIHQMILKKQKQLEMGHRDIPEDSAEDDENLDIESLTEKVADAVFKGKKEVLLGKYQYWVKQYKSNKVRYVNISPYLFLEQNQKKESQYALMAREGSRILWIKKNGRYFARWIDGTFTYMGN